MDIENKMKTVPVLLLTGYLGSGKTTLLNRILSNREGIRFAVIVNDLGEVNIDARLIEQGGVVDQADDSLVALQNGCICCTLKMDLVEQLTGIVKQGKFDYIVIEASGICEPAPIAQTICSIPTLEPKYWAAGLPRLDCIATVVDALRMKDEFASGESLKKPGLGEEDIENLVIQQIEFCNIVLLNKADEVSPEELERIRQIIRALQPKAEIITCNYGDVPFEKILDTQLFDFDKVATSAAWIAAVEGENPTEEEDDDDEDEDEHRCGRGHHHHHDYHDHEAHNGHEEHHHHEHEHHDHDGEAEHRCGHHHHHHHGEGEAEEYGIGTYVYYSRKPFSLGLFDDFVARLWPRNIIRAKGICWFSGEEDICYLFEQAGKQVNIRNAGQWYATMPKDELEQFMDRNPGLRRDWDDQFGDRMQKLVFIGQHMDRDMKTFLKEALDACLKQ